MTPLQSLFYRYTEESNSFEFFAPYSWKIVYRYSSLFWDPSNIKLFYLPEFDQHCTVPIEELDSELFEDDRSSSSFNNSSLDFNEFSPSLDNSEELKDGFENVSLESPTPSRKVKENN